MISSIYSKSEVNGHYCCQSKFYSKPVARKLVQTLVQKNQVTILNQYILKRARGCIVSEMKDQTCLDSEHWSLSLEEKDSYFQLLIY